MTTRNIIKVEGKTFSVTGNNVWMTAGEIAEIFNTTATAVNTAIKGVLRSGLLKERDAVRTDRVSPVVSIDVYSLEMIVAVSFRIDTCYTDLFRKWLLTRLTDKPAGGGISYILTLGRFEHPRQTGKRRKPKGK